jgi:hypothetical protein
VANASRSRGRRRVAAGELAIEALEVSHGHVGLYALSDSERLRAFDGQQQPTARFLSGRRRVTVPGSSVCPAAVVPELQEPAQSSGKDLRTWCAHMSGRAERMTLWQRHSPI